MIVEEVSLPIGRRGESYHLQRVYRKFKNLVYSGSQGKSSLVAAPPAPVDIPGKSLIGAFCYELFPGASSDLLTCRNL
ncbi:hypothetical protein Bca52824_005125 [Brassica carinata]|uniref:Uncharacterized protein n=1 Tax=Brassica carinata TaxID=52824 RepID=A0A8X7WRR2_BRACI|nr:hypothetical protein Bca52824_005125 [Brassica carinata]